MKFRTSFDSQAIITTIFIFIVISGILGLIVYTLVNKQLVTQILSATSMLIILIAILNIRIKYYSIGNRTIKISRMLNNISIDIYSIKDIQIIDGDVLTNSSRRMGVIGLLGYTGTFWNTQFGVMKWFMTNRNKVIYIKLNSDVCVFLSPDDPNLFYNTILSKIQNK